MTQIKQIKAEIKRRIEQFKEERSKVPPTTPKSVDRLSLGARIAALEETLVFIQSLPSEQPSEDFEKEVDKQWNEEYRPYDSGYTIAELSLSDYKETARHFAQWQKEQMMKSAFDGEITKFFDGNLSVKAQLPKDSKCCFGDKVKVIIIKEDEQ